ncbi:HAMP domain-containing sensor histidine kinase [Sphaerothrix gracilis]|uniref:sensor histidine kinase n=1 Tax=Sphaerothrix gracilis TaxID=3151835 RepID=UPI0031FE3B5F
MFQATRRRLALWYTTVTAILLLLFASGFYLYVRTTLVERVDDTLNHVIEVVRRSLVIELSEDSGRVLTSIGVVEPPLRVNVEATFRDSHQPAEDDRIDLEWFSPTGELLWSTFSEPPRLPLHVNPQGETVRLTKEYLLRQITQRVQSGSQILGYLRVSHPWFEVTKPTRQLILDLGLGISLMVGAVAAIGWFLSGLAIAPVKESYQQLKQFTADASHELRNPIAVIQTNVQVALADPEPDLQFQQGQLQVIERLTRRLGRLVDDLLFLTRQESGLAPLRRETVQLDQLLAEVIEEQQAIALDKSVQLVYRLPESVTASSQLAVEAADLSLQGDRDQLIRLFTNLVGNALQHTLADGTITLELLPLRHNGQPKLQVRVQDTGEGISPHALPHVFDRFYRADRARGRQRHSGSGLGLAIAKLIVDNHYGQIQLASQLGAGTTVTVTLPRTSAKD